MPRLNPHAWQLVWSFAIAGLTVGWLSAPVRDVVSLDAWTAVGSAVGLLVGLAAALTLAAPSVRP